MAAVVAPEEKRIRLDGEKRGLHDITMYLAEERVSRREAAFPRVAPFRGEGVLSDLKCHIFTGH